MSSDAPFGRCSIDGLAISKRSWPALAGSAIRSWCHGPPRARSKASVALTRRCSRAAPDPHHRRELASALTGYVIVVWNGSLEASRAVLGAIPLMHQADRVSIFSAPRYESEGADAADPAESLQWHGIRAHLIPSPRDESSTGAALVSAAVEQQATMIVMGAYTQSPLRQSFLGGVTRHLLAHAPVPLLMSH